MDNQFTTLITSEQLLPHINDQNWLMIDCTFYLAFPDQGYKEYLDSHIPNAIYAHLNSDLSGKGDSNLRQASPTRRRRFYRPCLVSGDFNREIRSWSMIPPVEAMAAARLMVAPQLLWIFPCGHPRWWISGLAAERISGINTGSGSEEDCP